MGRRAESWQAGEHFKVESILASRIFFGVLRFYVCWRGRNHTYNSRGDGSAMQDPSTKRESMAGKAIDMLLAHLLEAHRVASLRPAARDERPELEIKVPPPAAAKRGHARALLGFISHPLSRFGMPCFGLTHSLTHAGEGAMGAIDTRSDEFEPLVKI